MNSENRAGTENEHPNLHVLVVEDDMNQRLLLTDLLDSDDYEVSVANNGRVALEMLLRGETFDLILLDYMMPEMDGLELLTFMQNDERLKHIPVIMMSSDGEEQSIANCIERGAKDYFVKPVRRQNLKMLVKYVNLNDRAPSLLWYDVLGKIGEGACGTVHLVRSKEDQKLYALKKVELKNKNEDEKRRAADELILLKVLDSPTIIHYYEGFKQNNTLHMIMEYAEGGSLNRIVNDHQIAGNPVSDHQILDWLSQLVLGISLMHSKNILHRDIKPENIFLSKDGIAKLGDFGISKALVDGDSFTQTMCGTPYYMSPEVCNRIPYNQKSDVWSLGCSIYELAALKRPFDGIDTDDLKKNIREKEPDPLPSHVDPKIKMLVYLMLNKDRDKRPTIWQLAQIECLQERIVKFLKDNNLDMGLLPQKDDSKSKPSFPMNKLAEVAWNMRSTIGLKSITSGLFTKLKNVVSGEDLYTWFTKNLNFDYQEKIETIIDTMIQQEILFSPTGSRNFQRSPSVYYQFQMDRPGIAANMTKIFKGQARQGLEVSRILVEKMNQVLKETVVKNKEEEFIVDKNKLSMSKSFVEFVEASAELQAIQISSLERDEKIACFLNVYQVMEVHKVLRTKSNEEAKEGLTEKIQSFIKSENVPFYYIISQMEFTLDDIRHGILRGNKKAPNAYYQKQFSENDLRNKVVQIDDCRVLVLLSLEAELPEKLCAFDAVKLNDQLDVYCRDYLDRRVDYDPIDKALKLPSIFKGYKNDFGSNKEFATFMKTYTKLLKNVPEEDLLHENEKLIITYYDKKLND